jgi:hypothetical protein
MSTALDLLNHRLETARTRKLNAEEKVRNAQAELADSLKEVEIWNAAVILESRRNGIYPTEQLNGIQQEGPRSTSPSGQSMASLVRETIQRHPDGIASAELLEELKGKFRRTTYLYGVLKRLRDDGEVEVSKEGKYTMKWSEG